MKPTVRAWPFASEYLRDFAVLEERRNGLRLFPATEQLPLLSKAITREFESGLTTRLVNTDARADDWRKIQLYEMAFLFCGLFNAARADHLHALPFFTADRIAQPAIVQQVTHLEAEGNRHWPRFFLGQDFLPDLYLSGKQVVFTSHALDRFAQRARYLPDEDAFHALIKELLLCPPVVWELNGQTPALAFRCADALALLPFRETANQYLVLTTLSANEVSHLAPYRPAPRLHFHYGPQPPVPPWPHDDLFADHQTQLLALWTKRAPRRSPTTPLPFSWPRAIRHLEHSLQLQGYDQQTRLFFYDHVHGPNILFEDEEDRRASYPDLPN